MLKKIIRASIVLVLIGTPFFLFPPRFSTAFAANPSETTFQVEVKEVLSVSITTPTSWAHGNINQFLRNKVTLDVTSNHIDGFTASMISTDANSRLYHSSKNSVYLAPLPNNDTIRSSFTDNRWGFSLDDDDSNEGAGSDSSHYSPVSASSGNPNVLISNAQSLSSPGPLDIYFGSKSDITQASGTYSGTINFYVVSGIINENTNPNPPVNPATDVANGDTVTDTTNNRVVSTVITSNDQDDTTTTTTTISQYADPAGVTDSTSSNIYDGSMLTTGLAVTASIAAASGLTFFILAKRKKDDDEEETE